MIIIVQPVVPSYRVQLFQRMADVFGSDFLVYASDCNMGILTELKKKPRWLRPLGPLHRLGPGVEWQSGALQIPITTGDVVVISGNPRNLSSIATAVRAKVVGARTMLWGHYWSSTSSTWRFILRMLTMRFADSLLFYTDAEIAEYRASPMSVLDAPVFALNNGIETRQIAGLRMPYRADERQIRVLFVGRITAKANLPILLTALAETECQDVHLDIIGDGEREAEVKSLTTRLGLSERVTFHGGTVNEACIASVANRCRIFVYPGSVGLSLIHGLTYGLPALVHDDRWSHMPEIAALDVGINGCIFKRGDVKDLATQLSQLVSDVPTLDRMSHAAIASTTHTFNVEDMSCRFVAALTALQQETT